MPRASPACVDDKSTNVRVSWQTAGEDPRRAVAVALAAWAGAVALGAADDVFLRIGARTDLALAAFAALFTLGVLALDAAVRGWIAMQPVARIAAVALAGDAALAVVLVAAKGHALFAGVCAFVTLFVAPLALAAHLPLARALAARRLRSAAARPPAARRAAT